jgi:hypothetical protein
MDNNDQKIKCETSIADIILKTIYQKIDLHYDNIINNLNNDNLELYTLLEFESDYRHELFTNYKYKKVLVFRLKKISINIDYGQISFNRIIELVTTLFKHNDFDLRYDQNRVCFGLIIAPKN